MPTALPPFVWVGCSALSTLTCLIDRCWRGLYPPGSATVSSPDLRKPKKATQQAAHSIIWFQLVRSWLQTCRSLPNTNGVIGRRVLVFTPACSLLTPRKASSRSSGVCRGVRGGSPKPPFFSAAHAASFH